MNDQSSGSIGVIDTETESGSVDHEEVESMDAILSKEKEKLVYVFMIVLRKGQLRVMAFNPHHQQVESSSSSSPDTGSFFDVTDRFKKQMPPHLRRNMTFSLAALGPKIYFIGGQKLNNKITLQNWRLCSKEVFAFDTQSEQWLHTVASMNMARFFPPTVTYGNKIYVFGGLNSYYRGGSDDHRRVWAEFYDPQTYTWEYLGSLPPKELCEASQDLTAAVFKEQEICLLCARYHRVYVYSFKNNEWPFHITDPSFTLDARSWNSSVVVLNNTLFWECFGRILAIHYPSLGQPPVVHFTLPEALKFFGKPGPRSSFYTESCLVDAGNGKLCLVYDFQGVLPTEEDFVCFHTFELRGRSRRNNGQFLLHPKSCQTYPLRYRNYVFGAIAAPPM